MILYPSISICKKYAITDLNMNVLKNVKEIAKEDSDVPDIVCLNVTNSIQTLDEQLFFFTHPGVKNLTFPCTTTLGATTPGKPCIFPVYFGSDLWKECKKWHTDRPICFTKTDGQYCDNSTCIPYYDRNRWGYCDPNCKGESPEPLSQYNLAKSDNTDLWTSNIYDMNQWENGYCHTYDPPQKSGTELVKRIYFMIKEIFGDGYGYVGYDDYDIFLHEKGQFWPRTDMMSFGQSDFIQLESRKEIQIVFSIKEMTKFNSKESPCIEKDQYSFTKCLQDFAVRKSNCSISIMKGGQDKEGCSIEAFEHYFSLLSKLKSEQIGKIKKESGCYPKCKVRVFSYSKRENRIFGKKWISEFYLQPKSSVVECLEEYYSFDFQDLISSIGGYVGLFLGWSVLSLVEIFGGLLFIFNITK